MGVKHVRSFRGDWEESSDFHIIALELSFGPEKVKITSGPAWL